MSTTKTETAARQRATRATILAQAADLFWAKGYTATSMTEVAASLGMQKASLYHHIRTKESLLFELSVESLQHMIDAATAVADVAPLARLEALIEAHVVTLLGEQSKHATALTELRALSKQERSIVTDLRDRYEQIAEEAIRGAQASGHLRDDIHPKLMRLGLLGMLNWAVFWHQPDGELTPAELGRVFGSMFVHGAVSPVPA